MKGKFGIILALLGLTLPAVYGRGVADVVATLRNVGCYSATAQFAVTLPNSDTGVEYTIELAQSEAPADTIMPYIYLIDWKRTDGNGGFAAYFNGNHYRFSGQRLQEYHAEEDPLSFSLGGGVHTRAMYANLLPALLADEIARLAADSTWTVTLQDNRVVAERQWQGVTAARTVYTFTPEGLPLAIATDSNMGQMSEQSMRIQYKNPRTDSCLALSEDFLARQYPRVFEQLRQSNFKLENLPGLPMPEFALPTVTGERHAHHTGQPFRQPTLVVLLDQAQGMSSATIADVRQAVEQLPFEVDVIWVFTGTDRNTAEELVGPGRMAEYTLVNGRKLATQCGAALLPAVILCRQDGTVAETLSGYNPNMVSIVIEKALRL